MKQTPMNAEERATYMSTLAERIVVKAQQLGFTPRETFVEDCVRTAKREPGDMGSNNVQYFRAEDFFIWGSDTSVYMNIVAGPNTRFGLAFKCEINWSSTHRSIANATVAIGIYQRAVELASYIETIGAR